VLIIKDDLNADYNPIDFQFSQTDVTD